MKKIFLSLFILVSMQLSAISFESTEVGDKTDYCIDADVGTVDYVAMDVLCIQVTNVSLIINESCMQPIVYLIPNINVDFSIKRKEVNTVSISNTKNSYSYLYRHKITKGLGSGGMYA